MARSAEEDLYYTYLSQLLDPVEGHEFARRDSSLVMVSFVERHFSFFSVGQYVPISCPFPSQEWCKLSTAGSIDRDRVNNFYQVASRTSSTHLSFRRDLLALLDMSMSMKEYDLALELGKSSVRPLLIEYLRVCISTTDDGFSS